MNATWPLVISIFVGLALLLFGRFLYWIYVGVVGFAAGFALGAALTGTSVGWVEIIPGIFFGVIAAVLSIFLRKPLAAAAGFAVAGGAAVLLTDAWVGDTGPTLLVIVFVLVGFLGALLTWVLFEPALILLTSLAGAEIIGSAIDRRGHMDAFWLTILLAALTVIGIAAQTLLLARRQHPSEVPPA